VKNDFLSELEFEHGLNVYLFYLLCLQIHNSLPTAISQKQNNDPFCILDQNMLRLSCDDLFVDRILIVDNILIFKNLQISLICRKALWNQTITRKDYEKKNSVYLITPEDSWHPA